MTTNFKCKECGEFEDGNYEYSHANELNATHYCKECYKWHCRAMRKGAIIIEGVLYGEVPDRGQPFVEIMYQGQHMFLQLEPIEDVPERWVKRLSDTAEWC